MTEQDVSTVEQRIMLSDGRILAYLKVGDPTGRPLFYFPGTPGSRLEGGKTSE
jgi:hypothetical protein